mgnify:CR=1 FL=1
MTTTVWKYDLKIVDVQRIEMPVMAKLLCVQVQAGIPELWVLVNPDAPKELRTIATVETGHLVELTLGEYVGTYQIADESLVFHVFDGLF